MKTIRVENGTIKDIYLGLPPETIAALQAANPMSSFVDTEEDVSRGMAWPIVLPTPQNPPEPQPVARETVESRLNVLVAQAEHAYLKRWPELSKRELWNLFQIEMSDLSKRSASEPIPWPQYPALRGAISPDPQIVSDETVRLFANQIALAKAAHVAEIRKIETAYQQVLAEFDTLDDTAGFDTDFRWGQAYGN